jgi:hypothetical protein
MFFIFLSIVNFVREGDNSNIGQRMENPLFYRTNPCNRCHPLGYPSLHVALHQRCDLKTGLPEQKHPYAMTSLDYGASARGGPSSGHIADARLHARMDNPEDGSDYKDWSDKKEDFPSFDQY